MSASKTEVDSSLFRTGEVTLGGKVYHFRELSVGDNDAAMALAKQADGTYDNRVLMKMMVLKSSVDPKLTDADLAALPQRLYIKLCDLVNDLNYEPDEDEEDESPNA